MNEKISVIIPVYNVEAYLERCLKSVVENTYRNLEIICVNDGSTDGSGGILDRFAAQDGRFVVIHKENGGVSSARNRGLDAATGELIAFVDSDDWVHPQFFAFLHHAQQTGNYDVAICNFSRPAEETAYEAYENGKISIVQWNLEALFRNHTAKSFVWGRLYRRELLSSRFQPHIRFGEDAAFNAEVFCRKESIRACYVNLPLYFYFQTPGSLASRHTHNDVWLLAQTYAACAEKAASVRVKRIYWIESMKRALGARYVRSCIPGNREQVRECSLLLKKAVRELRSLPNASAKEKLMYSLFSAIPQAYRLARIVDDPTLLKMEKMLRNRKS